MKNLKLNGTLRSEFGKKASKSIRKNGDVPCVLYGGSEVIHFQVKDNDVNALIYTPDIFTIELDIEGKKYIAILQESQFHPVSDKVLHLDFIEISDTKPILMDVPVRLNGLSQGVKDGGKISQDLRKIKVKGLYKDIPEVLNIDVTNLGLGKTFQVGQLHFDNLEMVTGKQVVVCGVKLTRVARGLAAAAAAQTGGDAK